MRTSFMMLLMISTASVAAPKSISGLGALVARDSKGQWIKVHSHDASHVSGQTLPQAWNSFSELLQNYTSKNEREISLNALQLPLPDQAIASLGLGLSYPSHQKEVKTDATVYFKKEALPTSISKEVLIRPFTDYEAEVSLLLHRSEPHLFGYLVHNDLTDRQIQVRHYDEKNPGPGFSKAKSIPNFNAHGLLLAVGSEALWKELQVNLYLNGELVQEVNPGENVLTPSQIHRHVFSKAELSQGKDWALIGTGTPAGTIFYAPSSLQRVWLFMSTGFSMERAQNKWLRRFEFLKPDDVLEFRSEVLGHISTKFKAAPSE